MKSDSPKLVANNLNNPEKLYQNKKLYIENLAQRYVNQSDVTIDDLKQELYIWLFEYTNQNKILNPKINQNIDQYLNNKLKSWIETKNHKIEIPVSPYSIQKLTIIDPKPTDLKIIKIIAGQTMKTYFKKMMQKNVIINTRRVTVFKHYYGLFKYPEQTQAKIAEAYRVSHSRISKIVIETKQKIKQLNQDDQYSLTNEIQKIIQSKQPTKLIN